MNKIIWAENAVKASRSINLLTDNEINKILLAIAQEAEEKHSYIVEQNVLDLQKMDISNPMYDRLLLNKERIFAIAADIRNVASLPSPLGRILSETMRPNGMKITKKSVAFGVVGVVYEARPNVSFDVFALCLKSGNACVLKGGTDAHNSNTAIVSLIQSVLENMGYNKNIVTLLPAGREATQELLNATTYVDVIIPRGGQGLINFVRENSRIPVIETGAGICHSYFDEFGDLEKGKAIVLNAKTRRVSVCNALDCLVVHSSRISDLNALCAQLHDKNVLIYADARAFETLSKTYKSDLLAPATDESWGTEFLGYKMSVKIVDNIDQAIDHISEYSSKHSECIISENAQNIDYFEKMVDAACVYSNVSTAFTDGAQFGLGAEIGISTQKLHARGPMALEELCSYKWIISGEGQVRA